MIFWNVAGIKGKEEDFWIFIKEFDVIGLTETWLEEREEGIVRKRLGEEYEIEMMAARKKEGKGRAKGGIMLATKKGIYEEEERTRKWRGKELIGKEIRRKGERMFIGVTYMRECRGENREMINEIVETAKNEAVIIGGDYNARTGEKMGCEMHEERERCSKDKVINREGEELVEWLENKGLGIVNGRKKGDEEGNVTFISSRGCTVIDYIITNEEGWEKIETCKVKERVELDHLPLTVGWEEEEEEEEREVRWIERTVWDEESVKNYQERIEEEIGKRGEEIGWKEMKEMIQECMVKKKIKIGGKTKREEEWYDRECREKKREVRKQLRRLKKGKSKGNEYMEKWKEYRELIKMKKTKWGKELLEKLSKIKEGKEFWKEINKRRKKRERISTKIEAEMWEKHFRELLEGESQRSGREWEEIEEQEDEEEITEREIEEAIRKGKKKKAPGPDGIPNEAWKHLPAGAKKSLGRIMNEIWKGNGLPEEWRTGDIVPIFKKGEKEEVKNYRGITLMDTGYKIYAEVIRTKLERQIEEERMLEETQQGFRKKKGAIKAIYLVKKAVEKEIGKERGKAFVFFADIKAAFDTVGREEIKKTMEEKGIKRRLINRIAEIYKETKSRIRIGSKVVGEFWTEEGIRQGCPLSPILFNICMADLNKELGKTQGAGIMMGKKRMCAITYADDIALLATEEGAMKEMLKRLKKYIERRKLKLSAEKSKIMVFKKAGGREKKRMWKWDKGSMEEVKSFKYLGFTMRRNNGNEEHIKAQIGKAKRAMGKVWSLGERIFRNSWEKRMKLFDIMVRSILFYGVEIWGWREHKEIEALQERYIRWVLKLDRETPGYLIRRETGREKIGVKALERAISFEEGIKKEENESLLKECWKWSTRNKRGKSEKEREERLKKLGWNKTEYESQIGEREEVRKEMIDMERIRNRMEEENKLVNSKYCKEIRWIVNNQEEVPEYLKAEKNLSRKEVIKIARHRMGNEARANRYWEEEEKRRCRLCGEEEETLRHIWEECKVSGGKQKESWEETMERIVERREKMWQVEALRRRAEREKEKERGGEGKRMHKNTGREQQEKKMEKRGCNKGKERTNTYTAQQENTHTDKDTGTDV